MKIYIDFDGVILDTDKYIDELIEGQNIPKRQFIENCDWKEILIKSDIIHYSLDYLKKAKYEINLLSKISTLQEGTAKIKFLRENSVDINIHLVPNEICKNDVVMAKGNILIDDKVYNLDNWTESGGKAIFFNKDNSNTDIYGRENKKYPMIDSLECLVKGNYFD